MSSQVEMWAQSSALRGLRVFPLRPNGKVPAIKDWERQATADSQRISDWWKGTPLANYGIATGPSGLLVVDVDVHDGTQDAVRFMDSILAANGIRTLRTQIVETPSGGYHLYFRVPAGSRFRNTAGKLGPGIDTRAGGGYVVGAGSEINGEEYRLMRRLPIAPLPEWLAGALAERPILQEPVIISGAISAYVRKALDNEIGVVLVAKEGTRNAVLNKASWKLGRLVGSGVLARDMAETALLAAGLQIGLAETECRATIKSGLDAGVRRPNPLVVATPSIRLGLS